MSVFETLSEIDVGQFKEQKGKFDYLSWADALHIMLKHYPDATYGVVSDSNGFPYTSTPAGCFVTVWVQIDGIRREQIHPVLNHVNKTIEMPNAFEINTSIQRCLAKCIACHGLALYIFRGEDLPEQPPKFRFEKGEKDEVMEKILTALGDGDEVAIRSALHDYDSPEAKMAVWALFSSGERSAIKSMLSDDK